MTMISTSDLLHIISEIHQYSMLLVELRDATTFGILHSAGDRMTYFMFQGKLGRGERDKLVEMIYSGAMPQSVKPLALEEFLRGNRRQESLSTFGLKRAVQNGVSMGS